jgi:regulator of PEP synthase PpsR (kinase-PPPase family)
MLALNADGKDATYADRQAVIEEIASARRLFDRHNWPVIDVTRRSIEETAAAIIDLYRTHRLSLVAQ